MHILWIKNNLQSTNKTNKNHCTMKAVITVQGNLAPLFESEEKKMPNKRAEYEVTVENNTTTIRVVAKDGVALRAMIGGITKILAVHEKMGRIQ